MSFIRALLDRLVGRAPTTHAPPAEAPPAEAPPADDRSRWTPADWARVRAPERHRDRVLNARAKRWLDSLPDDMRPDELCRRFPRIVNRMAALWRDEGLTEHLFAELLTDTRGGRRGFPLAIVGELEMLYELHSMRSDLGLAAADTWDAVTQT
jgi:hypothetical protein